MFCVIGLLANIFIFKKERKGSSENKTKQKMSVFSPVKSIFKSTFNALSFIAERKGHLKLVLFVRAQPYFVRVSSRDTTCGRSETVGSVQPHVIAKQKQLEGKKHVSGGERERQEMVKLVVATTTDPASINPANALLAMPGWHPGPFFQVQFQPIFHQALEFPFSLFAYFKTLFLKIVGDY